MFKYILPGMVLLGVCSCKQNTTTDTFNSDSLKKHIEVLSSDEYMGRRPFSEGEEKTVRYMRSQFDKIGTVPGNGESYIQAVPLVDITVDADPVMKLSGAKGNVVLNNIEDYVIATERTDSVLSLDNDEVVFAGYGVVAPEHNWNDYEGIDVKGKIVLVLVNDPGFNAGDTTIFKGRTMTYYGRWTYKYEEAARQGAKACFIIHNTEAASYPYSVVQNSWGKSNMYLDTRGSEQEHCDLIGWLTGDAAKRLLAAAGKDTTLLAQADKPGFRAVPLGVKMSTGVKVSTEYNISKNVIARITGTKYPDEYIVYTAHWDHLGVGKPDSEGDTIYNGAIDNASGSAALLEMARAFKSLGTPPERSIIFLSVTAEEQGLLGSKYYSEHPIYPLDKTVAEINMDGINAYGKRKDVSITGQGQSDLEDYFVAAAKEQGRYLAPESRPEAGGYFRSDHFNFALKGVPALNAGGGMDDVVGGVEEGKRLRDEYTTKHYHQPSDEYDSTWTFEGGLDDLRLLFNVGKRLAYSREWPQWKDGSEFKAKREKQN
ncbi:MAG: M28 family peptidase [Chitinophagales bacterium]|nr:M28 family peptidase [Chitinophagales bacterium]